MAANALTSIEALSIQESVDLILSTGLTNTILLTGEPGIGKSTTLKMLEGALGKGYDYIYVDCAAKDMSDLFMRIPVHDTHTLEAYLTSLFKMDSKKPKVIMLDELGKLPSKMMAPIYTRLILEHNLGDIQLPEGSIVYATTNNTTDGVGDFIQSHTGNRLTVIPMRKPTVEQWLTYAADAGIDPAIRAWVALTRSCMDSYTELDADSLNSNPYIFNPQKKAVSFVTPRSLVKCNAFIQQRKSLGDKVLKTALAGTVGPAAAASMITTLQLEKYVQKFEDIVARPEKVPVPDSPGAIWWMINKAIDCITTQDQLSAYMVYVKRMSHEFQGLFFAMAYGSSKTKALAAKNDELRKWGVQNYDLMLA